MEIVFTPKAVRLLKKLTPEDRAAVRAMLALLTPWPNDERHIIRLSGRDDYRVKKGRLRIIFEVAEEKGEIHITHVGLRDEGTYGKK